MTDDCKLEVATNNISRRRGCVDSYLITLFSSSSCPIMLWWIHEIIIIILMITTGHSAEIGTDQIVTVEMKMQDVSSCHLTENVN